MLYPIAIYLLSRFTRRVTLMPGKVIFWSLTVDFGIDLIETCVIHSAGNPTMWRELKTIPLVTMLISVLWLMRMSKNSHDL